MKNAFLIGSQLYLRPFEAEDAPLLALWMNDPEVRHTLNRQAPISLADERKWIEAAGQEQHTLALAIVHKESDRLIGGTGLRDINFPNRHASFGIFLGDKSEWNKGYGTETTRLLVAHAFETLNLNRVWLHVVDFNQRGQRAYQKAGFRREGVLRQECFRAGRYWDTIVMAILREDWQK